MQVEIWSDIMCPFCYLGKRRFENALAQFDRDGEVDVVWKSFQLNPRLRADVPMTTQEYLAREKGLDVAVVKQMNDRLARAGKLEGLDYRFDKVIVANTFDAHRLTHLARAHGKQHDMEGRLFRAHFSEGRNVADLPTLAELGADVGLDRDAVSAALARDDFAEDVKRDVAEARELGVHGVPFFVFDRKYAVSGAQESGLFLEVLREAASAGAPS
ncbi:MAG TPA: DsbA family oxidoreductase [Gemmatimonadaceae bacterium]|nr:DsbA family oxidoreductase [Gemmatimonadaceae bacterium]